MEDNDRFVDRLLDSALARRRNKAPRPGLEGRILARVRATASEESTGGKAWKCWVAAATAVVVVTFVAIHVANRSHSPVLETSQSVNPVRAPSPKETLTASSGLAPKADTTPRVVEPKRTVRHERKPTRRVEAHRWPSQFPTPAPLSPEEKALVQYVRETPPQVLAASLFKKQPAAQPLEIKPFTIAPLEIQPLSVRTTGDETQ